jgi:hypothetical protein
MVRSAFAYSALDKTPKAAENRLSAAELRQSSPYTFVLWGDYFDEIATVIFVSAFRQVGLWVKVVGLAGSSSAGMNQLALGADLTLGEALALDARATCLIVPCSGSTFQRFTNDPRLLHFLVQICRPHTQVIVKDLNTFEPTTLAHLSITPDSLAVYSASDDLLGFAHAAARTLASQIWAM